MLVNLFFLFLPFYDPNNIPLALSVGSHFTSAAPPATYNGWVAGPFIYALFVPAHLAYVGSGYQLYAAYTALKVIFFVLTAWLAYGLYRVARPRGGSFATGVGVFVLANPLLLYVSYVWTEYDIVPIAFVAVGYVLLRFGSPALPESTRIVAAVALIAVSVFFYWLALVLVPTLLYYSRSRRELLVELGAFSAIFAALFAASVYAFDGNLGKYTGALVGSTSGLNRAAYFGFQYFAPLSANCYLVLLGGIAFALPLVLRQLRFTEPSTLFVVATLFVFTSSVPTPDNYLFVFPFALLSFLGWRPSAARFTRLAGLLAYPALGLLLISFSLTNGQPDGVGPFLWGYDLFHSNPRVLTTPAQVQLFLELFNVLTATGIALSFLILALYGRTDPARPFFPPSLPRSALAVRPSGPRRRALAMVGVVLVLVVAGSLLFNASAPDLLNYHGSGEVPVYAMLPLYVPPEGNVVRPIPSETYTLSGNTVQISAKAPPLAFSRWYDGTGTAIAGTIQLDGTAPRSTLAVNGTPFSLWFQNASAPSFAAGSLVRPGSDPGVRASSNSSVPPDQAAAVGYYNSEAYASYQFPPGSWLNRYYFLSFEPHSRGLTDTVPLYLNGPESSLLLSSDGSQTLLVYSGLLTHNTTRFLSLGGLLPLDQWSFAILHPTPTGLSFDIDGLLASLPLPLFLNGSTDLLVGSPPYPGSASNSFTGYATALYVSPSMPPIVPSFAFALQQGANFTNVSVPTPEVRFSLRSGSSGTTFTVDNLSRSSPAPTRQLGFGKYSAGPYGLNLRFDELTISQYAPDRYYLVGVFCATVAPFLLIAAAFPALRMVVGPAIDDTRAPEPRRRQ
ncbi:MAG: hypothetical protein L3K04_02560 [Thermoplasmata archaeon]|nr:hypothetical protein [Thermoplasmata archaeon]MCI4341531.1 hypothetical protein [Thermoplasmata archaeon]